MTLKSPYVCLSRKLALFLMIKYHAEISILNLRKYLTIKIDCNPRPSSPKIFAFQHDEYLITSSFVFKWSELFWQN